MNITYLASRVGQVRDNSQKVMIVFNGCNGNYNTASITTIINGWLEMVKSCDPLGYESTSGWEYKASTEIPSDNTSNTGSKADVYLSVRPYGSGKPHFVQFQLDDCTLTGTNSMKTKYQAIVGQNITDVIVNATIILHD